MISAYISAIRWGVRRSPSRSGSSPMASRISRTAFSIRFRSMPPPAGTGRRPASLIVLPGAGGSPPPTGSPSAPLPPADTS
jgi:hypothetical protein